LRARTAEELQLTKSLIEASTPKELDLAKYRDHYTEKLTQLIEKKVAGEEVVAPPHPRAGADHQSDGRPQGESGQGTERGTGGG
jgi:non-homologous end joining protein Ku